MARQDESSRPLHLVSSSGTGLWDRRARGEKMIASVDGCCWVCVEVSQSTLALAVRASRQTSRNSSFSCLLLGTGLVSEESGVIIRVDRVDLGRVVDLCLQPTAIVPGDVVVYCTVGESDKIANVLSERNLLQKLEGPALPPPSLLHLQLNILISPHSLQSSKPLTTLTCNCVYPSGCTLTPVTPLPIVPTSLARNLAGSFSISILQSTAKWGYLSMEMTRKLVLLLHTDPKSHSLPLVGVWVSGVHKCTHPVVWSAICHYQHSKTLLKKTTEERCLCLVYTNGDASLYEVEPQTNFTYSTAHIEICSGSGPAIFELIPELQEQQSTVFPPSFLTHCPHRSSPPQPSPLPTLDSQLSSVLSLDSQLSSVLSTVSLMDNSLLTTTTHTQSTQNETSFPPPPSPFSTSCSRSPIPPIPPYQPHMTDRGVNTGLSLLQLQPSVTHSIQNHSEMTPQHTVGIEKDEKDEVTLTDQGQLSIDTQSSLPINGSLHLDLCSYATSSYEDVEEESVGHHQFYQDMLDNVQELLKTPPTELLKTPPTTESFSSLHHHHHMIEEGMSELSLFPIPQITTVTTSCSEVTLDETAEAADVITKKYLNSATSATDNLTFDSATCHHSNQLDSTQPKSCILDLGRLRSLPKLL